MKAKVQDSLLSEVKKKYDEGYSVQAVADYFGVSLNAMFYFFRKHNIERRRAEDSNRFLFERKPPSFQIKKKLSRKEKNLFLAGIMLYWAEGTTSEKSVGVDFANSDERMVVLFMNFLREVCQVDESRLRGHLYCHSNQDKDRLISFWSNKTGIPKKQFGKPYVKESKDGKRSTKMKNGMIHVRYSDKKLLIYIKKQIEEITKKINGSVPKRSNGAGCK